MMNHINASYVVKISSTTISYTDTGRSIIDIKDVSYLNDSTIHIWAPFLYIYIFYFDITVTFLSNLFG